MDIDKFIIIGFMAGLVTGAILGGLSAWCLARSAVVPITPERKSARGSRH